MPSNFLQTLDLSVMIDSSNFCTGRQALDNEFRLVGEKNHDSLPGKGQNVENAKSTDSETTPALRFNILERVCVSLPKKLQHFNGFHANIWTT